MSIKKRYFFVPITAALALAITGCAGFHHVNPAGQEVNFKEPMLTQSERDGGVYVLLEKSLADGKYKLLSISNERQQIANTRQERVIFTKDLQKYAVDFSAYKWETYVDAGNYNQKSEIMRCAPGLNSDKLISYSPCSSEFKYVFVPSGITKAYVAGRISKSSKDSWEDARRNNMIIPSDPWSALSESKAIENLGIKLVEKK